MSIISSRKSLNSSILKSTTPYREETIRKSKQLRFQVEINSSVRQILKDVEEGNNKGYLDLIYNVSQSQLTVKSKIN